MTQLKQVYKCNICGNIVEVVHSGGGELVCCGQSMELQKEKMEENEGKEKHIPVIEKNENGIKVLVGSVSHPMEDDHYIEWIELIAEDQNIKKFLKPGDSPEAFFKFDGDNFSVRIYCNLHGPWKSA